MSDLGFELIEQLKPRLRAGDLAGCESAAIETLLGLPESPFQIAAKLNISNDPVDAARHFDEFCRIESGRLSIKAVYTEMNGFYINPGRWYCDQFAYTRDGGLENLNWISQWESQRFDSYSITGLEPLQDVYAREEISELEEDDAREVCNVVVICRFQRFMGRAAREMKLLNVPLYVTAHEFDYIARLIPNRC